MTSLLGLWVGAAACSALTLGSHPPTGPPSHPATVPAISGLGHRLSRSSPTLLDQVPSCAKPCVERYAVQDNCTQVSCSCLRGPMLEKLTQCLSKPCSIPHGLDALNTTQSACPGPARDRAGALNITSIVLSVVTGIVILARLIFRFYYKYKRSLGADDWLVVATVLVGLPSIVINIAGLTHHGLGRDAWTLPTRTLDLFARFFYAQQIVYVYLVTTYKLSLLFFYLSIFPGTGVRVVLWITVGFTVVFGVISIVISVFQCVPIPLYWLRFTDPTLHGNCIDFHVLGYVHGGVSVAIDIWMICIPLWEIRGLRLHWKKKMGAVIMFMTGAFVTIVSGLRLQSLVLFANSVNQTWDEWPVVVWSTVEINVGLICACLPTLRLILVRTWPRVFGNTIRLSSSRSGASRATQTISRSLSAAEAHTHFCDATGDAGGDVLCLSEHRGLKGAAADSGFRLESSHSDWGSSERGHNDGGEADDYPPPSPYTIAKKQ